MKVEISGCGDKLSFISVEDHKITRLDVKGKDKIIPKGTEILQIRLPEGTVAQLNTRLIEAIPQLIIVDCDPKEVNVTELLSFLEKERADTCPHGFAPEDDNKYALLSEALIQGHETDKRSVCQECNFKCVVKDVFSETVIRGQLEEKYGLVWNDVEVREDFEFTGFLSPCAYVTRKSDGVKGTLRFTHDPRFYFKFEKL